MQEMHSMWPQAGDPSTWVCAVFLHERREWFGPRGWRERRGLQTSISAPVIHLSSPDTLERGMKYSLVDGLLAVIFGLMWHFDLSSGLSPLYLQKYILKCRNFSFTSKSSCICNYYIFSLYSQPFLWGHYIDRCAAAYLPWWVTKGEMESMKKISPSLTAEGECLWNKDSLMQRSEPCCSGLGRISCYPFQHQPSFCFHSKIHKHQYTPIFSRGMEKKVLTGLMGSNRL